jgi:hypothetical protein
VAWADLGKEPLVLSVPDADKKSDWLPAPASGPFNLVVRVFWPKESVLDGTYKVPPVRKAP